MDEEEINYKTLRKIQQMEKNSPALTELKSDFYYALSEYLENLNNRFEKEESSQKKTLIKDEIQNTKKIATNIYEQREKKILLAAVTKARGGHPDLKNMIETEKSLFDPVLDLMLKSRKEILANETVDNHSENKKIVETEKKSPSNEKEKEVQKNSNPIVRVTEDIPEFIGTDKKKYNLRHNDIISLPEDMSNMLSKRGVVKKIE